MSSSSSPSLGKQGDDDRFEEAFDQLVAAQSDAAGGPGRDGVVDPRLELYRAIIRSAVPPPTRCGDADLLVGCRTLLRRRRRGGAGRGARRGGGARAGPRCRVWARPFPGSAPFPTAARRGPASSWRTRAADPGPEGAVRSRCRSSGRRSPRRCSGSTPVRPAGACPGSERRC